MPRHPALSIAKVERAQAMLADGMRVPDIAQALGISMSSVYGIKNRQRPAPAKAEPQRCVFASRQCSPPGYPLNDDGLCIVHAAREALRRK